MLPSTREGLPEPGIPLGSPRSFSRLPFPGHCHPDLVSHGLAVIEEGTAPDVLSARSGTALWPGLLQDPMCSWDEAHFHLGQPGSPGETHLLKAALSPLSPYPRSAIASFKTGNGLRAKEMCVWVEKVMGGSQHKGTRHRSKQWGPWPAQPNGS